MSLWNQNYVICKANKRCSLHLNQSDKSWSWALFPKSQGLRFPIIATWQSLGVINTAPHCLIWGFHNHCNFGLCCQQPQRAPQAMMETLLAVAVHQSDGRVGTMSLSLPNTHSLLSLCSVPIFLLSQACCTSSQHFCWHPWILLYWSCLFLSVNFSSLSFPPSPPYPITFQLSLQAPPKSFPKSAQPKGTREGSSYWCLQAHACDGMWRAAHVEISLSFVEIWLWVWWEVVSACLVGCHACLRTTALFVLRHFRVSGERRAGMGLFPGMASLPGSWTRVSLTPVGEVHTRGITQAYLWG